MVEGWCVMDGRDAINMIEITEALLSECTASETLAILSNLKEWTKTKSCEIYACALKKIAIGYKGKRLPVSVDYDMKVNRELLGLYAVAAEHGSYATELLEAGLKSKRGYDLLHELASTNQEDGIDGSVAQYVAKPEWSDEWVRMLSLCISYVCEHARNGYDILSVFTQEHDPGTFYEVCYELKSSCDDIRIPLNWLKDTYWRPYDAKNILYLYSSRPGLNWGVDIIQSWMTSYIIDDIKRDNCVTKHECAAVIDKWKNVSPILEYALDGYFERNDIPKNKRCIEYIMLIDKYDCDGDDLAQHLMCLGNVDGNLLKRNAYYHECITKWSGIPNATDTSDRASGKKSSPFNAAAIMGGN